MKSTHIGNAWAALIAGNNPTKTIATALPKCQHCGVAYQPNRSWQKYCSKICQHAAGKIRAEAQLPALAARIRELEHDKAELLRECAELRKSIEEMQKTVDKRIDL